jgi:hypothetical protein
MACVLLSSCIEIREEYYFNKDGSGRMRMTYDLSGMLSMIKAFKESGKMPGGDKAKESQEDFQKLGDSLMKKHKLLSKIQGVSKVKMDSSETDAGIMTIGFAFADPEALNKALLALYTEPDEMSEAQKTLLHNRKPLPDSLRQIQYNRRELVHRFRFSESLKQSMKEDPGPSQAPADEGAHKATPRDEGTVSSSPGGERREPAGPGGDKMVSGIMSYQAIISFPDEIKSVEGPYAREGLDRRSVIINSPLAVFADDAKVRIRR